MRWKEEEMYTFKSRVRFSEVDHSQLMTLPALINYFQDCSIFHSEDIGLGIDMLKEEKKAWVFSSWQIVVERYPKLGERIQIETWATGFEGLYGTRNFCIRDEAGNKAAYANSLWVFMDIERNRPMRPRMEDISAYGTESPLPMEKVSRKITLPDNMRQGEAFDVLRSHIDTNEHVNNCQYIQMAIEAMPECARAEKIRVEYKRSAVLGDKVIPYTSTEDQRKVAALCGKDEKPFAVVEFRGEGR